MTFIMDSPRISLIFVNYRSAFELALALEALFSYERDQTLFEVIVVNNDTSEERVLTALAKQFSFRLFSRPENEGFGTAANFGASQARGSIVGFLNPDTLWQGQILPRVAHSFSSVKEKKILGLTLTNEQGEQEAFSSGSFPRLRTLLLNNAGWRERKQNPDWVSGGAFFVAKQDFQELQGFDEGFFLYFEDVDFCVRARRHGIAIVSDPELRVFHRGGKSFVSESAQKRFFYASQEQYYAKHRPWWEAFFVRVFHRFFHRS